MTTEACEWKIKESVIHIFFQSSCGARHPVNYDFAAEPDCPVCGKLIKLVEVIDTHCPYYAPDCGGRVVCRAGLEKPECECGKIKEM
jgi:hypothetical protein